MKKVGESSSDLEFEMSPVNKKALIVKLGQIGDVIMAVPAAYALYKQGFEIYWVCGKVVRPLLECYSWINVIPADDKTILLGRPMERARGIFGLWRRIGFRSFDLCATLYYDRRYRWLTLPVLSKSKLSLSRNSRATALLAGRHHTDEYVRILLGAEDNHHGRSTEYVRPDRVPLSPLPEKTAPMRVAIVPGGTSNLLRQQVLRRWPIAYYVELARHLLNRSSEVVLLGGPEDAWVRRHFQDLSVVDCIGTMSLPEVISTCDACDAVVSHDTGPLHLAGLSTTCLVGIFGPTDPATFLPRREMCIGIWGGQGFACRPCYDGRDFAPCQFNGCMHQVRPGRVLQELDKLLRDRLLGKPRPYLIIFPEEDATSKNSPLVELNKMTSVHP